MPTETRLGSLEVTHDTNTSYHDFGFGTDATNGYDSAFGEQILPPLPPSGAFDARFVANGEATFSDGSVNDVRSYALFGSETIKHTLNVQWSDSEENGELTFNIPSDCTLTVKDAATDGEVLDEKIVGSETTVLQIPITNLGLTSFNIYFSAS